MSMKTHSDWLRCSHPGFSIMVEATDIYVTFEEESLIIALNLKREGISHHWKQRKSKLTLEKGTGELKNETGFRDVIS